MPLVTKTGFAALPDPAVITPDELGDASGDALAVAVPNDTDPVTLVPSFNRVERIVIAFPSSADGRGFSLAQRLRRLGFTGTLHASGHVIADQYPHALACGFDAVEINDELAARQPYEQWAAAAANVPPPYRAKRAG